MLASVSDIVKRLVAETEWLTLATEVPVTTDSQSSGSDAPTHRIIAYDIGRRHFSYVVCDVDVADGSVVIVEWELVDLVNMCYGDVGKQWSAFLRTITDPSELPDQTIYEAHVAMCNDELAPFQPALVPKKTRKKRKRGEEMKKFQSAFNAVRAQLVGDTAVGDVVILDSSSSSGDEAATTTTTATTITNETAEPELVPQLPTVPQAVRNLCMLMRHRAMLLLDDESIDAVIIEQQYEDNAAARSISFALHAMYEMSCPDTPIAFMSARSKYDVIPAFIINQVDLKYKPEGRRRKEYAIAFVNALLTRQNEVEELQTFFDRFTAYAKTESGIKADDLSDTLLMVYNLLFKMEAWRKKAKKRHRAVPIPPVHEFFCLV